MSDNVCTTKNLHVNSGIRVHDREATFLISNKEGSSVELVGWEGVLIPIAILRDALHREDVLKGIREPSRKQLEELRATIDKIEHLLPPESA